jgi:pimeloyl-ACP methyl ester carboxylesterase
LVYTAPLTPKKAVEMSTQQELEIEARRHHYHYFEAFEDSFVLISRSENVSTAIVFVHGFGGNACGTWNDFHLMVDEIDWHSWFSESDLFFFDYRSVWERIHSSSDRLLTFLDQAVFHPNPRHFTVKLEPLLVEPEVESIEPQLNEVLVLPDNRRYAQVVLVGHSEGGVVIRNAVDKKSSGNSQILRCHLRLFAPAIGGYAPAGLVGTLWNSPFLGKVLDALLRATPAYQDLRRIKWLEKLRGKTERNARRKKSTPAFRANILWGRRDYVVNPDKYDDDLERFEEQGHIGVCKPKSIYPVPLELVYGRMEEE